VSDPVKHQTANPKPPLETPPEVVADPTIAVASQGTMDDPEMELTHQAPQSPSLETHVSDPVKQQATDSKPPTEIPSKVVVGQPVATFDPCALNLMRGILGDEFDHFNAEIKGNVLGHLHGVSGTFYNTCITEKEDYKIFQFIDPLNKEDVLATLHKAFDTKDEIFSDAKVRNRVKFLSRDGNRITGTATRKPKRLCEFIKRHHGNYENIFNHWALATKPEYSVYRRHAEKLQLKHLSRQISASNPVPQEHPGSPTSTDSTIKEDCGTDFLAQLQCRTENSHFQRDFTQITAGNRAYYLVCSPSEHPENANIFFAAFTEEIGPKPAAIVDLHTGWDYLTQNSPAGLTDLEDISDIEISEGENVRIQIRKAKINGKEFFHIRVHNWPDNTAFSPECVSRINEAIERICNENGIEKVVMHCNGGLGRAPSLMYDNAVERVAQQANAMGLGCCCDLKHQNYPMVDQKINLAYVLRNMMLTGHDRRSTCGQSAEQFKSYVSFAQAMAVKYADPPEGSP
jgi:hypothetical protein